MSEKKNLPAETKSNVPARRRMDVSNEKAIETLRKLASEGKSYIEPLKVCYKTNKEFEDSKAKLGEFIFNGEGQGTKLDVYIAYYGFQCTFVKDQQFHANICFECHDSDYKESKKYIDFRKKFTEVGQDKYLDGPLLLLFIPELQSFASFFGKNTLQSGTLKLLEDMHSTGKQNFSIWTERKEGKNTWFALECAPIDSDFSVPDELLDGAIDKLLKEKGNDSESSDNFKAR